MADSTSLKLRPGNCVEVEGVIPQGCKMFFINLGKDHKNLVIHFMARFDFMGHKNLIIMNSMVDGVYGVEQKETVFPFQEGKDTMICFQFEKDKITIQLLEGKPFSFPVRLPIEEISYFAVQNLQLKSIVVK